MIWSEFKEWRVAKSINLQYKEDDLKYLIYGWDGPQYNECVIYKTDQVSVGTDSEQNNVWLLEFETDYKTNANKPYDFRSMDGLIKFAPAKFVENLSLYVDGENGALSINSGETQYSKIHYDVPYTLSGVDVRWSNSNYGDYIDFAVGIYIDINNEATFINLSKFGNKYRVLESGSRLFDVPMVKVVPSTIEFGGDTYAFYIRTTYVNVGPNTAKVLINLVGWK